MTQVFISFDGKNRYARDVVVRLSAQPGLKAWDFRSTPLDNGARIDFTLSARVRESDALLLLLTREAMNSPHVRDEVNVAFAADVRVLCLSDPKITPSDLPPELLRLKAVRWAQVDFARLESIENGVRDVCWALGLAYRERTESDPDFPIAPRLYEELRALAPLSAEYENRVYLMLWQLAEAAHGLYQRRQYKAAAQTLDGLIAHYQREFPEATAYYPVIARALCALHLERWPEATVLLEELERRVTAPGSPRVADPALHGSLGVLHYELGRFQEAQLRFERGIALGSKDPAPHCYLVMCRIQLGAKPDVEHEFAQIRAMASDVDRRAVDICEARACALLGRFSNARRLFSVAKLRADEPRELAEYASVLECDGDAGEAMRLLSSHVSSGRDDPHFMRAWAELQIRYGSVRAAHDACSRFVERHASDTLGQYLLLEALERRWPRQPSPLKHLLADAILTSFSELPPALAQKFHAAGVANTVLGLEQRAIYDFERAASIRGRL